MGGLEDRKAIDTALNTYLEAVRSGRPELWRQVFHPHATVVNASAGADDVEAWPIENFMDRVERLRVRVGTIEETARKVTIDLALHVASARIDFELRLGDETFQGTDYFSLCRAGDMWLITHKHYDGDRPL